MVVEEEVVVVAPVVVVVDLMVLMYRLATEDPKEVVEGDLGIDLINQHYKLKVIIIVMGMLILSLQHKLQYQA